MSTTVQQVPARQVLHLAGETRTWSLVSPSINTPPSSAGCGKAHTSAWPTTARTWSSWSRASTMMIMRSFSIRFSRPWQEGWEFGTSPCARRPGSGLRSNGGWKPTARYYLVPEKIEAALKGRKAGSNLVADYPNPDLAIEIDISRPRADRQAMYAALGVTELWIFDGKRLVIKRLGKDRRYQVQGSQWGSADSPGRRGCRPLARGHQRPCAWSRRIRSWAKKTLRNGTGVSRPPATISPPSSGACAGTGTSPRRGSCAGP